VKKTILTETEKDVSSIRCYRQMDASANSIEPQASRNLTIQGHRFWSYKLIFFELDLHSS
jgi:hypothetical protein